MLKIIPPLRGTDSQGSGAYLASRGTRVHNGIDIACHKGSQIITPNPGKVTRIGYPYPPGNPKKGHLRYVEVTERDIYRCRYFYIEATVKVGDKVYPEDVIGVSQGLLEIYPGITNHFHYEVVTGVNTYLDPEKYLRGEI